MMKKLSSYFVLGTGLLLVGVLSLSVNLGKVEPAVQAAPQSKPATAQTAVVHLAKALHQSAPIVTAPASNYNSTAPNVCSANRSCAQPIEPPANITPEPDPKPCEDVDGSNGGDCNMPLDQPEGIRGVVTIGPTCPVVSVDSTNCGDQPYDTTITVQAEDGTEVGSYVTDSGSFYIVLPAGNYILTPQTSGDTPPYAASQHVVVTEGTFTYVQIQYDSGIR